MGLEHKKRLKEQYGRNAVVAYEVIAVGGATASASGQTAISDANSVSDFAMGRAAKLDGLTVNVSPACVAGSGHVTGRAILDGAVVASAAVSGTGATQADHMLESEKLQDRLLSAGNVLRLDVDKGSTPSGVNVSVRAYLRLFS